MGIEKSRLCLLIILSLVGHSASFFVAPLRHQPHQLNTINRRVVASFGNQGRFVGRKGASSRAVELQNAASSSGSKESKYGGIRRLTAICSFLTGWADVALFLRHKTFATMMTGNTLWLMQALVECRPQLVVYYVSIIASYLAGVTVFRKADLSLKQRTMPICAGLVASLFAASEMMHFAGVSVLPVCLLSLGFGIINSVGTEVVGTLTFVVTGHMTKLLHQLIDRTLSRKRKPIERKTLLQNVTVLLGFAGGAFWGFILHKVLLKDFSKEFTVLGLLYSFLFLWQDMESLGGAWWLRKSEQLCELDDDGELCEDVETLDFESKRNIDIPKP